MTNSNFKTSSIIIGMILVVSQSVATPPLKFLDIARNPDGSVLLFKYQRDAIKYCEKLGARLPSARELAQIPINHGAKGFVKTCPLGWTEDWEWQGCFPFTGLHEVVNIDGVRDNFYYSNYGYKRLGGDVGKNEFWSSSIARLEEGSSFYYGIALSGGLGTLRINQNTWGWDPAGAWCVSDY